MITDQAPESVKCFLCNSEATIKIVDITGYQEPFKFNIYHCEYCDTSFSLPRVSDTNFIYDRIYEYGSRVPQYDRYWYYSDKVLEVENPLAFLASMEEAYWGINSALFDYLKVDNNCKILEVGCGLGYLTYSLKKAGLSVVGLDISTKVVENAITKFGNYYIAEDIFNYAKNHQGEYDIIILTEVIEHVDDALSFMKILKTLINDNGHIIITTPNKTFFKGYGDWYTELPPIHSWWFSEKSVKQISTILSMNTSFIDFANYYSIPGKTLIHNLKEDIIALYLKPVLNSKGELISDKGPVYESSNSALNLNKSILGKIKNIFGESFYLKTKVIFYKFLSSYSVGDKRGRTICAIISNQN